MSQSVFKFDGVIWVTLAELARRKGVSRASIGERVKRLEESQKIETQKKGRNKLVNIAQYDLAVGQVGDAIKENASSHFNENQGKALRDAQAEQASYRAELLRLELAREEGKTRTVQEIEKAAIKVAQAIVRETEKFPKYAEGIAKAAGGKDLRKARIEGKKVAIKIRELISNRISELLILEQKGTAATRPDTTDTTSVSQII